MLPAGAVRLTEAFLRSDRPRRRVRTLSRYLEYMLDRPRLDRGTTGHLHAGMGGTIRALAKIDQRLQEYPLDLVHGYVLTRPQGGGNYRRAHPPAAAQAPQAPRPTTDRADVLLGGALASSR